MNAVIDWLLEPDNPSVCYFALRDLEGCPGDDPDLRATHQQIMDSRPVQAILEAQSPEGYWAKPGAGYTPKYRSTVWQILWLAELGADGTDRRVRQGCEYVLTHALSASGGFSALEGAKPSGVAHCLNGNLIWAFLNLGYADDERVQRAVDWFARAITGERFERYYASGMGPGFKCAANNQLPCAWGVVKSLRALAAVPAEMRSDVVIRATNRAVDFLLSHNLARADYPYRERISGEWFKFGFPLSYTSDVLETLLALSDAGRVADPRLAEAVELVISKRDNDGRWSLKHSLNGKMWADIEQKGQPSKWITLRALRVLKAAGLN